MNALLSHILGASDQQGGLTGLILPLLLLGPLMYLMIVPQRKQRKKHAEFLAGLNVGDEVVTSGGIHGVVTFLEDDLAHVEVDTDVVIRVSKASLARREKVVVDVSDASTGKPSESTTATDGAGAADDASSNGSPPGARSNVKK